MSALPHLDLEALAIEDFLHPLTEFGDSTHAVELFENDGSPMPEPYRGLLVHGRDMTSTLERFHRERPRLEVLAKRREGNRLFRQVLLRGSDSDRVVEYGAIRIELQELEDDARRAVLAGSRPLGGILADHGVPYVSRPQTFFGVRPGLHLRSILGLSNESADGLLFGRKNLLEHPRGGLLAEVVEILPPVHAPLV